MEAEERAYWKETTGPFCRPDGGRPAEVHLQQVSDNAFRLEKAFTYRRGAEDEVVTDLELLDATNLASIPGYLGWFIRRHGRHTAAALVHDQLVREGQPDTTVPFPERVKADMTFRDALAASGVPVVRTWLMWTAVTVPTRGRTPWRKVLMVAWFALALAGMALLVWACVDREPLLAGAALLAPLPAAALWGRQWRAGLIGGYALPVAIVGSVPGVVAYHAYWAVEQVVGVFTGGGPPTFNQR